MRKAIFVVGPESSGTRMMTQFFIPRGYKGGGGHSQPWDDMRFRKYPDRIVFRRSMPHGGRWPDLVGIVNKMQAARYVVYPIFTWRDPRYMALSQVNASHVGNTAEALKNIALAVTHLDTAFIELGIRPVRVVYEEFISNESFREALHGLFTSVDAAPFEVRNENSKYNKSLAKVSERGGLQTVYDSTARSRTLGF